MLPLSQYEYVTIDQIEKMAEQSEHYLIWKDRQCNFLGANKNACELTQCSSYQDLLGLNDLDLNWLSGGHTAEYFQYIDKRVMSGYSITNEKEILLKTNKQNKIVSNVVLATKRPILHNGICLGVVLEAIDVTHSMFPTLQHMPTKSIPVTHPITVTFTAREKDCIKLLLVGYSYKRISTKLSLSNRTVEFYIERIRGKLHCNNKQELIDQLLHMGYLPNV